MEQSENQIKYKYTRSKFVKRVTFALVVIVLGVFLYLLLSSSGTYLSAWFSSFVLAAMGLVVMSVPRHILLTQTDIEIHCVLELTSIPIADIKRISKVSKRRMKYTVPILGSYGFGGYFGYYMDLRKFTIIRMYATQWDNLVMIHDIFGDRYIISCQNSDEFIQNVTLRFKKIANKEVSENMTDEDAEEQDNDD